MSGTFGERRRSVGGALFGGTVGAFACGFLGFAVVALLGGGWSFLFELMGVLFGGLGGAIAPLVAGTERKGPGRWPASLLGRAILWGIIASLVLELLCGGMFAGRDRATQAAAIVYVALCGAIAPLVAWADRARPRRGSAGVRTWLLAFGPLLIGVAVVFWRFGLFVLDSPNRDSVAPQATSTAAPPAPAFKPTTWWDVVAGDTAAAFAPTLKATHDAFDRALALVLGSGLPIAFIAYGAFLGGRAVRFFPEHDGTEVRPPSTGPEAHASYT
jgi:hypothetical protein